MGSVKHHVMRHCQACLGALLQCPGFQQGRCCALQAYQILQKPAEWCAVGKADHLASGHEIMAVWIRMRCASHGKLYSCQLV